MARSAAAALPWAGCCVASPGARAATIRCPASARRACSRACSLETRQPERVMNDIRRSILWV
eukprot:2313-Eustigmatos_ZCMA.PRE.1